MADLPVVWISLPDFQAIARRHDGYQSRVHRDRIASNDIALVPQAALEQARAEVERLTSAIRWALGAGGEFPVRMEGQGQYWWRTELRRRAAASLGEQHDQT